MYQHKNIEKKFQEFWDKKWWKNTANIWPTSFWIKTQNLLEKDFESKKLKILDAWAWAWRDSFYFSDKWQEVIAFDFSQHAVNFINKNSKDIISICWDYTSYEFWKEEYDIIYSSCSLHYFSIEDFEKIIDKLFTSLKNGWVFLMRVKQISDREISSWNEISNNYFTNWSDYKYKFTKEELFQIFWCFWDVHVDLVTEKHQLLAGGEKLQEYFDVTVTK